VIYFDLISMRLSQSHEFGHRFDGLTRVYSSYFLFFFLNDYFLILFFNIELIEN
jgi:hypothetical protein